MKPIIYENLKELSYGELLQAISNIKDKMQDNLDETLPDEYNNYYTALVTELDNRTKEQWKDCNYGY